MNATCERLVGTLRRELLDRSLILSEPHLQAVLAEYQEHSNAARQAIDQRIPDSAHHPPRVIAGDFRIRQIRRATRLTAPISMISCVARDLSWIAAYGTCCHPRRASPASITAQFEDRATSARRQPERRLRRPGGSPARPPATTY